MKALTIKQPFAALVAKGIKTIENRTWYTSYRGTVLIHAGASTENEKRPLDQVLTYKQLNFVKNSADQYDLINGVWQKSAIIGEVQLINIVKASPSIWALPNNYHWVLGDAILYDEPILNVKGGLSLWNFER